MEKMFFEATSFTQQPISNFAFLFPFKGNVKYISSVMIFKLESQFNVYVCSLFQEWFYKDDKLTESKYMDNFPFPFYIILKDIESLPRTLADLLRQVSFSILNILYILIVVGLLTTILFLPTQLQWFELMQHSRA